MAVLPATQTKRIPNTASWGGRRSTGRRSAAGLPRSGRPAPATAGRVPRRERRGRAMSSAVRDVADRMPVSAPGRLAGRRQGEGRPTSEADPVRAASRTRSWNPRDGAVHA